MDRIPKTMKAKSLSESNEGANVNDRDSKIKKNATIPTTQFLKECPSHSQISTDFKLYSLSNRDIPRYLYHKLNYHSLR